MRGANATKPPAETSIRHLHRNRGGLHDQERPGTDPGRNLVRQPLAKRRLFVVDDVDRMLVGVRGVLAPAHRLLEGDGR